MNTRKILLCVTALSMLSSTLTACGQKNDNAADNNTVGQSDTAKKTTIRFLNFKPEIASVYDEVAAKYKEETGNTLIVETAANNTYEQTLSAKMSHIGSTHHIPDKRPQRIRVTGVTIALT